MKPADLALHFEAIKYAYRQNRDGTVISFVVHPNEVPPGLATAHIGARYQVVVVEIGDDEEPIKKIEPAKKDWRDMAPATQAGIRCSDPRFVAFLRESRSDDWHEAQEPAECVRLICGVESRSMLGTVQAARVIWKQLDDQFQAWLVKEHA